VSAAWETNGPPFSIVRSPISSSDTAPSTRIEPCRNSVGPSTATAPPMVTVREPRVRTTAAKAATVASSASVSWTGCRSRLGRAASNSTPRQAAPKRINIGIMAP
jgi:hypothetical protein